MSDIWCLIGGWGIRVEFFMKKKTTESQTKGWKEKNYKRTIMKDTTKKKKDRLKITIFIETHDTISLFSFQTLFF